MPEYTAASSFQLNSTGLSSLMTFTKLFASLLVAHCTSDNDSFAIFRTNSTASPLARCEDRSRQQGHSKC